jgi:hypothetical protein
MDKKEKAKEYYQRNRTRELERNKKYIAEHYERYQEYQAQYWLKRKAKQSAPESKLSHAHTQEPKPVVSIRFPEGGITLTFN